MESSLSKSTFGAIKADTKSVRQILDQNKYEIDVFQREYMWQRKQIEDLIEDLSTKFLSYYEGTHERSEVEHYASYYMGSIILSQKEGRRSIIDGQQRLTSITLLLIYLKNLQSSHYKDTVKIDDLIFSETYGQKSYNIEIEDRKECMEALYNNREYDATGKGDSSKNIVERYDDIEEIFPEKMKDAVLPFFIDWLKEKVIFVEINTYSDEDAYLIFETVNDRGLNLTSTDMLKGYLLSHIDTQQRKNELNELWKRRIAELKAITNGEDLEFFKAWLRAKYAETIRQSRKGAENEDFENIARFHSWVKENTKKIGLQDKSIGYYKFVKENFDYYSKLYSTIQGMSLKVESGLEQIYYLRVAGFAPSFYFPLLMAPIELSDDKSTRNKKLALVARFIESFVVLRSVNNRTLAYASIRNTMYNLIKEIRGEKVEDLADLLKKKLMSFEEKFDGMMDFRLHRQNKRFVHFLLARITDYIERQSGYPSRFEDYMNDRNSGSQTSKPFEIEHIWSANFDDHRDEFVQQQDFEEYRNMLGALVLLPRGINQSYGADSYQNKLNFYCRENLLAKSLSQLCYEKNPSFLKFVKSSGLEFTPHEVFKKDNIKARQLLYKKTCEQIWDIRVFDEIVSMNIK